MPIRFIPIGVGGAPPAITSTTASSAFSVRGLTATGRDSAFTVRALTAGSAASSFTVRTLTSAAQDSAFSVRNLTEATRASAFSVQAAGITSTTIASAFSVRGLVASVQPGAFSVRTLTAAAASGAWAVRGFAGTERAGAFTVRNLSQAFRASGFSVGWDAPTIGRPMSDMSTGAWTASSGPSLFAMLDEVTPDATDFISTSVLGAVCEVALNTTRYPGSASQILRFRASSSTGSSVIVRLNNGATVIKTVTQALSATDDEYTIVLSAGEIAAITSGALSVRLESA